MRDSDVERTRLSDTELPVDASRRGAERVDDAGTYAGFQTEDPSKIIVAQLGLLEDEIVYRLAMLCINVLHPLKNAYPNIVVVGGFRKLNSGISQHELGEAVDLQIRDQTPELLLQVADYIQKNLLFDQLVLNFSNVGDKQPWIHVSFSPNSLRGQVLTKDLADEFHEGLFLVEPLHGEEAAEAERAANQTTQEIEALLTSERERAKRLNPTTAIGDEIADSGGDDAEAGVPGEVPDESGTIVSMWNEIRPAPNEESLGKFTESVAIALHQKDPNWGHVKKSGAQRQYNGHAVDAIYYKGTFTAVDIIIASKTDNPQPGWGVKPSDPDDSRWLSPI